MHYNIVPLMPSYTQANRSATIILSKMVFRYEVLTENFLNFEQGTLKKILVIICLYVYKNVNITFATFIQFITLNSPKRTTIELEI